MFSRLSSHQRRITGKRSIKRTYVVKPNVKNVVLQPGVPDGTFNQIFAKETLKIMESKAEIAEWANAVRHAIPSEINEESETNLLREALILESTSKFLGKPEITASHATPEALKKGFLNSVSYLKNLHNDKEASKYLKSINYKPVKFVEIGGKFLIEDKNRDCQFDKEYLASAKLSSFLKTEDFNGLNLPSNLEAPIYTWFSVYTVVNQLLDNKRLFGVLLQRRLSEEIEEMLFKSSLKAIKIRVTENRRLLIEKLSDTGSEPIIRGIKKYFFKQSNYGDNEFSNQMKAIDQDIDRLASYSFNEISASELVVRFNIIRNKLRRISVDVVLKAQKMQEHKEKEEFLSNWDIIDRAHLGGIERSKIESAVNCVTKDAPVLNDLPSDLVERHLTNDSKKLESTLEKFFAVAESWDEEILRNELAKRATKLSTSDLTSVIDYDLAHYNQFEASSSL